MQFLFLGFLVFIVFILKNLTKMSNNISSLTLKDKIAFAPNKTLKKIQSFRAYYTPVELDNFMKAKITDESIPTVRKLDDIVAFIKAKNYKIDFNFLDEIYDNFYTMLNSYIAILPMLSSFTRRLLQACPTAKFVDFDKITPNSIAHAILEPSKIKTKSESLSDIPVTKTTIKCENKDIATVWINKKEEQSLPANLKELLKNPKTFVKQMPTILENITAQRHLLDMYTEPPMAGKNGLMTRYLTYELNENVAGLSDLELVKLLKDTLSIQKDTIESPIGLFNLPSSYRRAIMIPKDGEQTDFLYEFKVPGRIFERGVDDKRYITLGDFFAAIQMNEMGLDKNHFYTPVAAITLHNYKEKKLLWYNKEDFTDVQDQQSNNVNDLNIIIYKRPDGTRLSEIFGGYKMEPYKFDFTFPKKHIANFNKTEFIKDITSQMMQITGEIDGAIGTELDHIGNFILTKQGKVVAVNDFDKEIRTKQGENYNIESLALKDGILFGRHQRLCDDIVYNLFMPNCMIDGKSDIDLAEKYHHSYDNHFYKTRDLKTRYIARR